jgi:hypothetical protein
MIERVFRLAAASTALAVATLLFGCGSASPATRAQAINLRPSDIPRSSAGIVFRQPVNYGPLTRPIERCDGGLPGPRGVLGYSSRRLYVPPSKAAPPRGTVVGPLHLHPLITARSVVYMFASEAAALRELGVVASVRARGCLGREAQGSRESQGKSGTGERKSLNRPVYAHVHVATLPTAIPHSYGLRVAGNDTFFPGPARPVYRDSFGFVARRAFVVLYTLSEPRPFPVVLERRLLNLLYDRATGKKPKTVLIIR